MQIFDPRSIAKPVYEALTKLESSARTAGINKHLKEQKAQAFALYSYLATWGMMRLKAEETAISGDGKKAVIQAYFSCLQELLQETDKAGEEGSQSTTTEVSPSKIPSPQLVGKEGLKIITDMGIDEYLGLTGLGLTLAQEFSFWATAIYVGVGVEIDGDE